MFHYCICLLLKANRGTSGDSVLYVKDFCMLYKATMIFGSAASVISRGTTTRMPQEVGK